MAYATLRKKESIYRAVLNTYCIPPVADMCSLYYSPTISKQRKAHSDVLNSINNAFNEFSFNTTLRDPRGASTGVIDYIYRLHDFYEEEELFNNSPLWVDRNNQDQRDNAWLEHDMDTWRD